MAVNNVLNVLNVTELDFENIKTNMKEFLKNQDHLQDFDFEGSAMSVLIELLAYNTHYQSYYLNMIANEMFLDSAILRSSVVSKAKHLNYLPQSKTAATAQIDLEIFPYDNPVSVVLDRKTRFESSVDRDKFIFVPEKTYTLPRTYNHSTGNYEYKKTGIVLKQGIPAKYKWNVDTKNPTQRYIIPNPNIDTTTLIVRIQYSVNSDYSEIYDLAKDTSRISGEDNIYYLQEIEDKLWEIYFGDGVLGKQLENGNIVHIEYLTTQADAANHCSTFNCTTSINGYSDYKIDTRMKAIGGDQEESIDSIRFNAPRTFEGQNRAVTIRDYKTVVPKLFPNAQSISIWGGEDNIPPYYGRVMIAIKPDDGYYMSETVKSRIENEIKDEWGIVSIQPMIVDPEYTMLQLDIVVRYDEMLTILSADQIEKKVEEVIYDYNNDELSMFDNYFRYSKFMSMIDATDDSITNNLTRLKLKKELKPSLNTVASYELYFNNPIKPSTLQTTYFDVGNPHVDGSVPNNRYFADDGMGNINLNIVIGETEQTYVSKIGSINYEKGIIKINSVKINWYEGDTIDFIVLPQNNDIVPQRNQILSIDMMDLKIAVQDDIV